MKIVSPLLEYLFANKMMKQVGSYEGEYTKSVYLPFSTTALVGTQYYFTPDEVLDSANNTIRCIEIVDSLTNAVAPVSPARDNLSIAQLRQGSLYLTNRKREIVAQIPLALLVRRLNAGKVTFFDYPGNLNWHSCFIQFDSLSTGINQTHCLTLRVSYFPKEQKTN